MQGIEVDRMRSRLSPLEVIANIQYSQKLYISMKKPPSFFCGKKRSIFKSSSTVSSSDCGAGLMLRTASSTLSWPAWILLRM
jgi:hypothetical protein